MYDSLYNSRRYRRRSSGMGILLVLAALILILLFCGIGYGISHANVKHQTFTVIRLDDQYNNGKHRYMVFGKNDQGKSVVYKDTDAIWFGKWNSSNLWGELQDGHRYNCKTSGFRLAVGSHYPNLISCTDVGTR